MIRCVCFWENCRFCYHFRDSNVLTPQVAKTWSKTVRQRQALAASQLFVDQNFDAVTELCTWGTLLVGGPKLVCKYLISRWFGPWRSLVMAVESEKQRDEAELHEHSHT